MLHDLQQLLERQITQRFGTPRNDKEQIQALELCDPELVRQIATAGVMAKIMQSPRVDLLGFGGQRGGRMTDIHLVDDGLTNEDADRVGSALAALSTKTVGVSRLSLPAARSEGRRGGPLAKRRGEQSTTAEKAAADLAEIVELLNTDPGY